MKHKHKEYLETTNYQPDLDLRTELFKGKSYG